MMMAALSVPAAMAQHELNLQDADMQTLISTVSEITGKSFIVDPRVEGTVTVIARKAMTADEIYDVFQSVLRVHGFATVEAGDFIKVVPEGVARQDRIPLGGSGLGDDQLVTHVIDLQHVAAKEVVDLIRPLMPQGSSIGVHEGSNTLIVSDRAGNVARVREILRRIDTASDGEIEVIALRHASAADVVRSLNLLNQGQANNKAIADERTNSILLTGDPSSRLRLKALVSHLDTPLEAGGSTQVIYLQYADAAEMVDILSNVARTFHGGAAEGAGEEATIMAHAETNSLVISAPPAVFRVLQGIVRQLDIRRQQVQVEAIIAEVSSDFARELGVQWQSSEISSLNEEGIIGGTSFPTNGGTGPNINQLGVDGSGLAALGGLGSGLNLGYLAGTIAVQTGVDSDGNPVTVDVPRLGALARALDSDVGTNVLSTPSVVTLDHQEAVINVGQEVPFLTGSFTNTGANNSSVNPFQTVDRRDVGIKLTVTPHINRGDTVVLDIQQEVSSLSPQAGAVDLITNKREIATRVMVPDQNILVLGGLVREDVQEVVEQVPGLGRIPLLGNMFKYRNSERVKRNLMIFIRPSIMRDPASQNAITSGKYRYIREQQQQARDNYGGLLPVEELPLLPDLSDYERVNGSETNGDQP